MLNGAGDVMMTGPVCARRPRTASFRSEVRGRAYAKRVSYGGYTLWPSEAPVSGLGQNSPCPEGILSDNPRPLHLQQPTLVSR
jgi:hypothetical protein